jgi:zinc transporter, ZIP family
MNERLLVIISATIAAFLTYLGAPVAERLEVPHREVSGTLQFAGGIITALVVVTLMPPAVRIGLYGWAVLAFFAGGML